MAVYFEPQRRNYLHEGLMSLAMGALDKQIGGMFERSAQARDAKQFGNVMNQAAEAMTPGQARPMPEAPKLEGNGFLGNYAGAGADEGWGSLWNSQQGLGQARIPTREGLLGAMAKSGASPAQMDLIARQYQKQLEYQDQRNHAEAVRANVGILDPRGNPLETNKNALYAQVAGGRPEEFFKYTAPNYIQQAINLGDRTALISLDPLTGKHENTELMHKKDPTKVYESDINLKRTQLTTGAQIYAAKLAALRHSNGGGGSGKAVKPMSPQQRLALINVADKVAESSLSPEQKWNQILNLAGDSNEALSVMAQSVFSDGQVPTAAAEFFKTGGIRKAGIGGNAQSTPVTPDNVDQISAAAAHIYKTFNGDIESAMRDIDAAGGITKEEKIKIKRALGQMRR